MNTLIKARGMSCCRGKNNVVINQCVALLYVNAKKFDQETSTGLAKLTQEKSLVVEFDITIH